MIDRLMLTLLLSGSVLQAGCTSAPERADHLLLITVDTLRADRLGPWGGPEGLTPVLDELAAGGRVHLRALSEVPITLPSHATLLTGRHPTEHGIRYLAGFRLAEEETTLAEILSDEGLATGAVLGAWVLDSEFGLDQGFDSYDDLLARGRNERRASEVVERGLAWLDRRGDPKQRWFLWLHLFDPHHPYAAPEPHGSRHAAAPYDGEVAYVDSVIGELLAELESRGLRANTLIALTSDHGESLGDHGEPTHGLLLHDATLHVPLILNGPGIEAGGVDTSLTPLSQLPGLLLSGLAIDRELPPGAGPRPLPAERAYAETWMPRVEFGWSPLRAWTTPSERYVDAPSPEFYDLATDPGERRDLLSGGEHPRAEELSGELAIFLGATPGGAAPTRKLSPDERERLRALGYVGSGVARAADDSAAMKAKDPKDMLGVFIDLLEAREAMRSGDLPRAAQLLDSALALDPENLSILLNRGDVFLKLGSLGTAQRSLQRVLELAGDEAGTTDFRERARLGLGGIAARQGRLEEAAGWFRAAWSENPRNPDALFGEGSVRAAIGQFAAARELLEEGRELFPADPRFEQTLGQLSAAEARRR